MCGGFQSKICFCKGSVWVYSRNLQEVWWLNTRCTTSSLLLSRWAFPSAGYWGWRSLRSESLSSLSKEGAGSWQQWSAMCAVCHCCCHPAGQQVTFFFLLCYSPLKTTSNKNIILSKKKVCLFIMKNVGHVHCWKSHGAEGINSGMRNKFRWHFALKKRICGWKSALEQW